MSDSIENDFTIPTTKERIGENPRNFLGYFIASMVLNSWLFGSLTSM